MLSTCGAVEWNRAQGKWLVGFFHLYLLAPSSTPRPFSMLPLFSPVEVNPFVELPFDLLVFLSQVATFVLRENLYVCVRNTKI